MVTHQCQENTNLRFISHAVSCQKISFRSFFFALPDSRELKFNRERNRVIDQLSVTMFYKYFFCSFYRGFKWLIQNEWLRMNSALNFTRNDLAAANISMLTQQLPTNIKMCTIKKTNREAVNRWQNCFVNDTKMWIKTERKTLFAHWRREFSFRTHFWDSPSLAPGFEASAAKQRGHAACKSTLCSGTLSLNGVKSNFLPLQLSRISNFNSIQFKSSVKSFMSRIECQVKLLESTWCVSLLTTS